MLPYLSFLSFLDQIHSRNKAKVVIGEDVVFVEPARDHYWHLSIKILDLNEEKTGTFFCHLPKKGVWRWQEKGAFLKIDSHGVYLVQEIFSLPKYIPFRSCIQDFIAVSREWREVLLVS